MDIARLPVTAPPGYGPAFARQPGAAPQAAAVDAAPGATPRRPSRASAGQVLQGELLERPRVNYQSTHAFLDERALGQARPVSDADPAPAAFAVRSALDRYRDPLGPAPRTTLAQGRAVDFFV